MKMSLKRKPIMVSSVVLLLVIWRSSIAVAGITGPKLSNPYSVVNRKADMAKILSVLENKMGGQKLPEKAMDKLFTLSDGQIRLIASLAERIANDGHTGGADIAFLLITALIILL